MVIDLPPDPCGPAIFKHFVTDELAEMRVGQIKVYANQYIRDHPKLSLHSLVRRWKDITSDKIKKCLALYLLMGIIIPGDIEIPS